MGLNIYPMVLRFLAPLSETTITVERRTQIVGNDGLVSTEVEIYYDVNAIIVDQPPNTLERNPEYQTAPSTIEVTSAFVFRGETPIQNAAPGYQPDIVTWHNTRYVVTSVLDLSKGGLGYVKATCSSIQPIDSPPGDE